MFLRIFTLFFTLAVIPVYAQEAEGASESQEQTQKAQERTERQYSEEEKEWIIIWTPYVWLITIDGESGTSSASSESRTEFGDVIKYLEGVLTSYLEVRMKRFIFIWDLNYLQVGTEDDTSLADGTKVEVDADISTFMTDLLFGYQVIGPKWNEEPPEDFLDRIIVDLLAGIRYVDSEIDLEVEATQSGVTQKMSTNPGEEWIDPVVGAQVRVMIVDDLYLNVRGDVGGFGVGSEFSWNGMATLRYLINDTVSVYGGYRVLDIDYDDNDYIFNNRIEGPLLGFALSF